MKKLANLLGAKALNKNEQKSIHGGGPGNIYIERPICEDGCPYTCTGVMDGYGQLLGWICPPGNDE